MDILDEVKVIRSQDHQEHWKNECIMTGGNSTRYTTETLQWKIESVVDMNATNSAEQIIADVTLLQVFV